MIQRVIIEYSPEQKTFHLQRNHGVYYHPTKGDNGYFSLNVWFYIGTSTEYPVLFIETLKGIMSESDDLETIRQKAKKLWFDDFEETDEAYQAQKIKA